ncbi:hypothetical protein GSVR_15990 [Geobacter sp. SVR]|nr:hypothetical protein GSVR_15990 [Geobacter sp. SVR]
MVDSWQRQQSGGGSRGVTMNRPTIKRQVQLIYHHSDGLGIMTKGQFQAYQRDRMELFNINHIHQDNPQEV